MNTVLHVLATTLLWNPELSLLPLCATIVTITVAFWLDDIRPTKPVGIMLALALVFVILLAAYIGITSITTSLGGGSISDKEAVIAFLLVVCQVGVGYGVACGLEWLIQYRIAQIA